MGYSKQVWVNNDPATPISAARLAHMETQYDDAVAEIISEASDLTSPLGVALNGRFATNDELAAVQSVSFTSYGIRPRIYYTGTAWPARSAGVPSGYTGPVDFDSGESTGAPSPTDMVSGDRWYRVAS